MNEFSMKEIIPLRYSCRHYEAEGIPASIIASLQNSIQSVRPGPFGTKIKISLTAAEKQDQTALRGLGTYGFIKHPGGFIIGTVQDSPTGMVDFGYMLEQVVLQATAIGLGTCWLGGTFTKSAFAKRVHKSKDEIIPAVIACGIPREDKRNSDLIRRQVKGDRRLGWDQLFFDQEMGNPLTKESAGAFQTVLEMVRLGPSASNKQPWRIIKEGKRWHFVCQRTPHYGKTNPILNLIGLADMQRIDMGIAMVHFAFTAEEEGIRGAWVQSDPGLSESQEGCEYIATWLM